MLSNPCTFATRIISISILMLFLLQQSAFASQISSTDLLNDLDQSTPFFSAKQRQALNRQLLAKMQQAGIQDGRLQQRIAALSDKDLQSLANRFDEEVAGGDILGTAVFIFLVLLVTDILGYTDIFPFVKHPRRAGHPNRPRTYGN